MRLEAVFETSLSLEIQRLMQRKHFQIFLNFHPRKNVNPFKNDFKNKSKKESASGLFCKIKYKKVFEKF